METRDITTLQPNPNNDRLVQESDFERLKAQMIQLGNHSIFLITPEGMVIDGNTRLKAAQEVSQTHAEWKNVECKVVSFGEDSEEFYPLIDGVVIKDGEIIPKHYVSLEAMYKAFALSRNGQIGYDDSDAIANKWDEWQLDPSLFDVTFFPPKSVEETLADMDKKEKAKKYQIIIDCTDETDVEAKYTAIRELGYTAKKKV